MPAPRLTRKRPSAIHDRADRRGGIYASRGRTGSRKLPGRDESLPYEKASPMGEAVREAD